jgi:hypothetical protein
MALSLLLLLFFSKTLLQGSSRPILLPTFTSVQDWIIQLAHRRPSKLIFSNVIVILLIYTANCEETVSHILKSRSHHDITHVCKIYNHLQRR